MSKDNISCLIISDFTIDGLKPMLMAGFPCPQVNSIVTPFDQVVPTLLDGNLPCWKSQADFALVWTRPNSAIGSFARLLSGESLALETLLSEVDQYAEYLRMASERVQTLIVPSWTWPSYDRGLGVLNLDTKQGPAYFLMRMNARLIEHLASLPNAYGLDASRWVGAVGWTAQNPKLWHMGKIAFSPEVFTIAASDIKAVVRAVQGQARKLVLVDLDDTLWGGTVGDVGWQNLELGGHNPIGEAFCAFQHSLKALTRRGILLGIISKNTEHIALEAIDSHPEMLLGRSDFVGWAINWRDKAQNVRELVEQLNLGLSSVVFIDDNPAERARIREALPEVFVPEWPSDKLLYTKALAELDCFDATYIGEEDKVRTSMYIAEQERSSLQQLSQSLDDYLSSLELKLTYESLDPSNVKRAAQLLNKTNQMNLQTRRMTEAQFSDWAASFHNRALLFRVTDRFGDYGLTGIAGMTTHENVAEVSDFVLSCRVMGRGIENAMLWVLIQEAHKLGFQQLVATYQQTDRNAPCQAFFREQSGFLQQGHQFTWNLLEPYPLPSHLIVHDARSIYKSAAI